MQGPAALGLTPAEWDLYVAGFTAPAHHRRVRLEVLTLDEQRVVATLTTRLLDGQVIVNSRADDETPTRIATMTVVDPTGRISFEPATSTDTPIHRQYLIRVTDSRLMPGLDRWVDCEVCVGVVWDYDRAGALVTITLHGKDRLHMGNAWRQRHFPAKTKKVRVIRELAADTGETRTSIPDLPGTTPKRLTITRMDRRWPEEKKVAASLNRQLYFNGAGVLILRRRPTKPVFTITPGMQLTPVSIDRDPDGIFNTFVVLGGKPKGSKKRVQSKPYDLPPSHDLSAASLGRNGAPMRLVDQQENDQFKTAKACNQKARERRDDAARTSLEKSVDIVPLPFLDEGDPVRVIAADGTHIIRAEQWTFPLGTEGSPPMTLGSIRRTTQPRRTRRRRFGIAETR